MSLAGRPKTIAKNARASAVAKARADYRAAEEPVLIAYRKILVEQLAPLQAERDAKIRKADLAYFEAIGDTESARLIREAA